MTAQGPFEPRSPDGRRALARVSQEDWAGVRRTRSVAFREVRPVSRLRPLFRLLLTGQLTFLLSFLYNLFLEKKKKLGRHDYLFFSRGNLDLALELYRKAETYVPDNIKLKERWLLFVIDDLLYKISSQKR